MTTETCGVRYWKEGSKPVEGVYGMSVCGRPAKGVLDNGRPGCGVHLAAQRRKAASNAARDARQVAGGVTEHEVAAIILDEYDGAYHDFTAGIAPREWVVTAAKRIAQKSLDTSIRKD